MTQSLKELLAAKAALDMEIAKARTSAADAALSKVQKLVTDFGFTQQQVFPTSLKKPVRRRSIAIRPRERRGQVEASLRTGSRTRIAKTSSSKANPKRPKVRFLPKWRQRQLATENAAHGGTQDAVRCGGVPMRRNLCLPKKKAL